MSKRFIAWAFFDDVQADYRPIAFNLRGKGKTLRPRSQDPGQLARLLARKSKNALGDNAAVPCSTGPKSPRALKRLENFTPSKATATPNRFGVSVEATTRSGTGDCRYHRGDAAVNQADFIRGESGLLSESELKGLMATKEEWIFFVYHKSRSLGRDILTNDIAISVKIIIR